jgi:disulfide bond formation protein DsbB
MSAVLADERARTGRADVHAIWFGLAAFLAFAAVGLALVSQHAFDMQPCPWCILQRLIYVVFGIVALIGLVGRRVPVVAGAAGVAGLVLACCGLAAAGWQVDAEKSASCNLTLADRIVNATGLNALIPSVFEARASCADAAVSLLGVPYALWAGSLFVLFGALTIVALRRA